MTLEITQNGSVYENDTTVSGAPGVRISGTDVRFVNTSTGRVDSTLAGSAAISIEAAGAEIINEAGGIINAFAAGDIAIQGSATDDMVQNAGTITGRVDLAGGADLFIRLAGIDGSVDLGIGNDIYRIDGGSDVADTVNGGLGTDRVELTGDLLSVDGGAMIGFEELRVGDRVLNIENFSNYLTVTIDPAGFTTFVDSSNPLASLALAGGVMIVGRGSVFNNVTGSAGTEDFEVNSGTILGSIDLAGGNDIFGYTWSNAIGIAPTLGGAVSGGAGTDRINFAVDGGQTIDVSQFTGFEELGSGLHTSLVGDVRLTNVDGYQLIQADGGGGMLRIADSDSPDARAVVGAGGNLILESTATIGLVSTALANASTGAANSAFSFNITNNGTILGNVELYLGDDRYDGRLGAEGGTIFGYAGNDVVLAGAGVERIEGGAGDDYLDGGAGADTILGGLGNDTLLGGAGADGTDGGFGNDFHYVDDAGDVVIERVGEGTDRVLTGVSYVLGANAEVEVLSTNNLAGTAAIDLFGNGFGNIIYGNAGANYVSGGAGNDQIAGNGGNDTLLGGAGIDVSDGGAGNDFHYVDNASDVVVERAGEGTGDRVLAGVSFVLAAAAEVEILSTDNLAGTAAIDLFGNGFANSIYGNAGANYLSGGGGNDLVIGNAGDDVLFSGAGIDTTDGGTGNDFHYVDSASDTVIERVGEGTGDRILSSVSYVLSASAEVEILSTDNLVGTAAIDLFGSSFGNIIYGNAGANYLSGGGGNDQLSGNAGNDTLLGGVGIDSSDGGAGNDFHYVDHGSDVVIERVGEGTGDRVLTSVSYVLFAAAEVEILSTDNLAGTAAIDLFGNDFANSIYGNAGANYLSGNGGADILLGNAGNDTLIGGAGIDATDGGAGSDFHYVDSAADVVIERVGEGSGDRVLTGVSYTLAADAEVEILSTSNLAGTGAIDLSGNAFANTLYGNAGSNRINGGGGRDLLQGSGGADEFEFDTALNTAFSTDFAALAPTANVDRIADFGADDEIMLDNSVFAGLAVGALATGAFAIGTTAGEADDRILYDPTSGALMFDADGAGGAAAQMFAFVSPGLDDLSASAFTVI